MVSIQVLRFPLMQRNCLPGFLVSNHFQLLIAVKVRELGGLNCVEDDLYCTSPKTVMHYSARL